MEQQITRIAPEAFSQGLYTQTRHQAQGVLVLGLAHEGLFFSIAYDDQPRDNGRDIYWRVCEFRMKAAVYGQQMHIGSS
jgi:hypothetical protein